MCGIFSHQDAEVCAFLWPDWIYTAQVLTTHTHIHIHTLALTLMVRCAGMEGWKGEGWEGEMIAYGGWSEVLRASRLPLSLSLFLFLLHPSPVTLQRGVREWEKQLACGKTHLLLSQAERQHGAPLRLWRLCLHCAFTSLPLIISHRKITASNGAVCHA